MKNPPCPFFKEEVLKSPFEKGGFIGDLKFFTVKCMATPPTHGAKSVANLPPGTISSMPNF
jgi:hypothetical protein